MNIKINEKIKVVTLFDPYSRINKPLLLKWNSRTYKITKLGFHHKYKQGRTLMHVFSVTDGSTFFRIRFDTDTLDWVLEETYDGSTH